VRFIHKSSQNACRPAVTGSYILCTVCSRIEIKKDIKQRRVYNTMVCYGMSKEFSNRFTPVGTLGRPYQGAGQGRKGTRRLLVPKQIECGKEKSMTEQIVFGEVQMARNGGTGRYIDNHS